MASADIQPLSAVCVAAERGRIHAFTFEFPSIQNRRHIAIEQHRYQQLRCMEQR